MDQIPDIQQTSLVEQAKVKKHKKKHRLLKIMGLGVAGILTLGAYYLSLPIPVSKLQQRSSGRQTEYVSGIINEKDNGFYDYLVAARFLPVLKVSELTTLPSDPREKARLLRERNDMNKALQKEFNELLVSRFYYGANVSETLRDYITQCQFSFEIARRGLKKKKCEPPKLESYYDILPHIQPIYDICRAMVVDAKIKQIDGKYLEACKELFDVIGIADAAAKDGALIGYLVQSANYNFALNALSPSLKYLEEDTLENVVHKLQQIEANYPRLSKILNEEMCILSETVDAMTDRGDFAFLINPFEMDNRVTMFY